VGLQKYCEEEGAAAALIEYNCACSQTLDALNFFDFLENKYLLLTLVTQNDMNDQIF
jgi:hypothetical protein